ncbi:DNA-binding protein [Nonlabens spongiae]|uniref:DNA-binding protein n=1 Tax=Nonlabens spongiae TaxID=331648 RepID=A0A1W6MLG6_9FLAO|nr:helix-turn-helix transcriptional regulator [Nonlabens spongiae]ARN78309.1 DNA-binding protein [Nonlabens spongiae]
MDEEYIKLIFGLKLRQIRNESKLSLFGLSKLTGMSKSYLNEIENGKKYPKPDKIAILSDKLDVPYDQMVSLKLDKNLAPVGDLLKSNILKEIPLELFGIKESTLIDIVSNAPAKVNAFISTIIEIAQSYNLSKESFYLASLRSYQEANNNYFPDLEKKVLDFSKSYHLDLDRVIKSTELEEILVEEYGYSIIKNELEKYKLLGKLRSVFIPKSKTLLLTEEVDRSQLNFIYAKELAYNFLEIADRLNTFPWIKFESFDQVLHNFYASYFAGALILPKEKITEELGAFFSQKEFDLELFKNTLVETGTSPETYFQRLTNILPSSFNLKNLFFLRFTHEKESSQFSLNKELHLTHHHSPRSNESDEHYCRRWVSLRVLQKIAIQEDAIVFDAQISHYPDHGSSYLVISAATADPFKKDTYRSTSLGLLINNQLRKKIKFLDDDNLKTQNVGVTCERCAIQDCGVRQAAPVYVQKDEIDHEISSLVDQLENKYS